MDVLDAGPAGATGHARIVDSYGVLYAVAGVCAIIGGGAILPVTRVR